MFTVIYERRIFYSGFAFTDKRDMRLDEVPVSMSLLGIGMGTMLTNLHMCGIMLVLRAVFKILVMNASPTWPRCIKCPALYIDRTL